MRLVKIDHVIWRYLSISLICLTYAFYGLTYGLKIAEPSLNSNPWYFNQNDFFELLLQQKLSFIRVHTRVIWRAFDACPESFPAFQNSLNLRFLVQHFATFLLGFSVWCFKMEINPLPGLLHNGFTITEIVLFYGGVHLNTKICRFLTFFWQDGDVYIMKDDDAWKHSNTGWVLLILH